MTRIYVIDHTKDVEGSTTYETTRISRTEYNSFKEARAAWSAFPPSESGHHLFLGRKEETGYTTMDCK